VADDNGEALVRRYFEEALNPGSFDQLAMLAQLGAFGP
jgi:hypothetical protein